jgi:hypothetical protein
MKRRSFIAGLGSMAAWPVVAAQQMAMPEDLPTSRLLNRRLLNCFHHSSAASAASRLPARLAIS